MESKRNFTEDKICKCNKVKELQRLKQFATEIKSLVRYSGKTNVVALSELDYLLVKYNINIGEIK